MVQGEARPEFAATVTWGALAVLAAAAVAAVAAPLALWVGFGAVLLVAAGGLALRFPVAASLCWFVLAGMTPEMLIGDVVGDGSLILAGLKLVGLALALVCVLRFGVAADWCNPGLAFVLMFAVSLVHGRAEGLDMDESLRSLIGSVAPFAFSFSRLSRPWAAAIIRTMRFLPLILVAAGAVAQAVGLRPLFVADNGWRMEATGHPAFLGGFCLAAIEACLLELLRDGRRVHLGLLLVNMLILVASGARAPMAIAVGVTIAGVLLIPSARFGLRPRVSLVLGGLCALPAMAVAAASLSDVRLFRMLTGEADNLSGRDLIWPFFQEAWSRSPWFGWGVGAGKTVMPEGSELVKLLGTTAAHDEYLRIGVEGGWLGLGTLILLFLLWVWRHTRRMAKPDRTVMRLVMLAFAVHAYTDNVLIATTSSVLFTWVSAVFARGRLEAETG
jgi:O-antigen ligase